MIVGNGLLATAMRKHIDSSEDLIFAKGVSDSLCTCQGAFNREEREITTISPDQKFIYFSSISSGDTPYLRHKRGMESLIRKRFTAHLILRIPQIVGFGGNLANLFNFFKRRILDDDVLEISPFITRSLVDVDDLAKITSYLLNGGHSGTISFFGVEKTSVLRLSLLMFKALNKTVKLCFSQKHFDFIDSTNPSEITAILNSLGIQSNNYTSKLVKKYA